MLFCIQIGVFMRHFRLWSLLTACTASASLLLGATTNWKAFVCNNGTNEIYPIDLPIGQPPTAESPLTGISLPDFNVITPDATRALVTSNVLEPVPPANLFSLNLTANPISILTSTKVGDALTVLALTPDGSKTYAMEVVGLACDLLVRNTNDLSPITTIPSSEFEGANIVGIAISPTKEEGYVATDNEKVYVINTASNTVTESYSLPTGSTPINIVVTPNGSEVYLRGNGNNIVYITLSDGIVHTISGVGIRTGTIAIAPDGSAAYAIQDIAINNTALTKINTSTHSVIEQFAIPSQLTNPSQVAITPDGKTACITDEGGNSSGQFVAFIDTTTGSSSTLQLSSDSRSSLAGISITPDQAPTALFTSTVNQQTVAFDASASSSPIGGISTYRWDFGDGQTSSTSSPTASHTYTTNGTFTVTLTVTNVGGTSTTVTFTGQMVSNNGGPSAVTTQQVTVQATGVTTFKGKVHRDHKHKKVFLKTKWSKSLIPHTKEFQIFARNKKIETIKANHKHKQTLRLHPHHFPRSISKDYRHYLDHKYNIRVVDTTGHISEPTFVHVVKH
jgi:DNA-binding beta-propeller fold protein YncE